VPPHAQVEGVRTCPDERASLLGDHHFNDPFDADHTLLHHQPQTRLASVERVPPAGALCVLGERPNEGASRRGSTRRDRLIAPLTFERWGNAVGEAAAERYNERATRT
jgi:hypothetical protein